MPSKVEALQRQNILERWGLTVNELTQIVDSNPSMRGMMIGYVAEYMLRRKHFSHAHFTEIGKDDDHDRKNKSDLRFIYKGQRFRIECKSLQTAMIKRLGGNSFSAKYQCDASDSRPVRFEDGSTLKTACLLIGEFEIVAVNLFAMEEKWKFAFAFNKDLPRSKCKRYTEFQRSQLLTSLMPITWPIAWPYVDDPYVLMDLFVAGQKSLPKPA